MVAFFLSFQVAFKDSPSFDKSIAQGIVLVGQ